ncbi:MAG: hypothetical protein NDI82_12055 [Anaeromyxobacteraceae bacterium]|nr:hypothetical protein [Anaeromyxobacteraceae bacterium]
MKNATATTPRHRSGTSPASSGHSAGVTISVAFSATLNFRAAVTGFSLPSQGPPWTRAAS